jgi:ParB-like chromosome segregation protein Spo0J
MALPAAEQQLTTETSNLKMSDPDEKITIANASLPHALTIHPLAEKFPAMPQKDFEELKESIRKYGLFEPFVINDKCQILDGRHRYRAISELGWSPLCQMVLFNFRNSKDLTEEQFIYDSNIHRRHLTDDQRVMLAAEFLPFLKAEAEVRKVEHLQKPGMSSNNKSVSQDSDSLTKQDTNAGKASTKLAEKAQVSRYKAEQAIIVKEHAPELVSSVASGEMTLKDAAKKTSSKMTKPKEVFNSGIKPHSTRSVRKETTFEAFVLGLFKGVMNDVAVEYPDKTREDVIKVLCS